MLCARSTNLSTLDPQYSPTSRRIEPRHITCYTTTARTSPCHKFHQHRVRLPSFHVSIDPYAPDNRSFSCTKRPLGSRAITTVAACSGRLGLWAPHDQLAGSAPLPLGIFDFAQSNLAKGRAGRLLSVNNDSRRPRFMSSWCSREDHRLGYDVSFPGRGGRGSGWLPLLGSSHLCRACSEPPPRPLFAAMMSTYSRDYRNSRNPGGWGKGIGS